MLTESSAPNHPWLETPFPVYMKVYFFNMINAKQFEELGQHAIMEERGPYTFRQTERKVALSWHPDGTVSYRRQKFW